MLPLITVVIVNYNRCEDLRKALQSVESQDYPSVEIIVIDNASVDDSNQMLRNEFPRVRLICLERNIGMDGYSVACREATGKYIFQMDNDSLMPHSDVLTKVEAAFAAGPENLAIVATRVEEFNESIHTLAEMERRGDGKIPAKTFGFHSGGVAFNKALMDKVGYYNEDVFLYGAEIFVQMKALAAGYRLEIHPEILMFHKMSGVARSTRGIYYEIRNRYWFWRHYASFWRRVRVYPSLLLHDLSYCLHKRGLTTGLKAIMHGFGPLPDSLLVVNHSNNPDFLAALKLSAKNFGIRNLLRRSLGSFVVGKSTSC